MIASRTGGRYVRADEANAVGRRGGRAARAAARRRREASRVEPRERAALVRRAGAAAAGAGHRSSWGARASATSTRSAGRVAAPVCTARRSRAPARRGAAAAWRRLGFGIGDLERGNRLYREGRYEEAVAAYTRVVESGKATPQVHYNLGTALLALGRFDEADRTSRRRCRAWTRSCAACVLQPRQPLPRRCACGVGRGTPGRSCSMRPSRRTAGAAHCARRRRCEVEPRAGPARTRGERAAAQHAEPGSAG
jgi:hypothetical protein